ncbi:ATP-binding cassette domain-containing protein [Mycoplasma leonicaptivi]|uniref:ATP-binding cassette domain-containing protein n=1 Tax=Mycoplasma leonicaptivi TaxID=36742 RepID=UPI0005610B5B|nr:ATP-binding cassette domain-containing protein [Mycoplasma leonicaptivi]
MNNKKTILEISNLKKFFVNKHIVNKAVDDVSFELKEGEIVGLIGESGSGKTTIGRSLLRLYEDFNGFVRLDGKLISGKRISKKRNKFLRKNIQMIFQDPMAALNGQNTIFSILKEPLIVNGIIKEKTKDIKIDWDLVQKNFHYTFLEQALKLKLENLKITNSLSEPFTEKWSKQLNEITFSETDLNFEDQFNSYFSYLEEKNKNNSKIINNLYSNTNKLISLYYKKQQDFRNKEIDLDEIELKNAREEFEKQKNLLWHTQEYFDFLKNKKTLRKEFFGNLNSWKENFLDSFNSVNNLINELKNEAKISKNEALSSPYIEFFAYKIKLFYLNKKVQKFFQQNKYKLAYLDFVQLKEFIGEIEKVSLKFFLEKLNIDVYSFDSLKLFKNKVKQLVEQDFVFEYKKYFDDSKNTYLNYKKNTKESFKKYFNAAKNTFKNFFVLPKKNIEAYTKAKNEFEKANQNSKIELKKYIDSYKIRINDLQKEIEIQEKIKAELIEKDKNILTLFDKIHKTFIQHLQTNGVNKLKQKINSKDLQVEKINKLKHKLQQLKVDLKVYQTNVDEKLIGNKSFDIESKYLNKDLNNIYHLLGISAFDIKYYNNKYKKIISFLSKPYKFSKIKSVLVRNIIYKSLEDVGLLKQFAYRYPHEFSGGQRQRIVIARALITEPKVIVADEPIASLDISIQAQVVNLLKDLCQQKNIGMIFIAHDLSMIEYIADRVQIMHLGKIVESGKTEEIYKKPIHPYTINLFKAIPKISNANEKFKDIKFELSYMSEQKFPNIPEIVEIKKDEHFVYGTKTQVEKWLENK